MPVFRQKSFEYCECERTQQLAAIDESPIMFDPESRQFTLEFESLDSIIRHQIEFCYFCGGRLPARVVKPPYEHISDEEASRLKSIVKGSATIEDVIKKIGEPDRMFTLATYSRLSSKAEVQIFEKPGQDLSAVLVKKREAAKNENT